MGEKQMKIKCTPEEYAQIIRTCQRSIMLNECKGCVMVNICSRNILEDVVQFEIEDREELELEYITYERND